MMSTSGGWVLLQNIELVARWLPKLEKKLESLVEAAHAEFRVFLSSLPQTCVPVQVLQNSIKLTNEPPSGLRPNMLRAYGTFTEAVWEVCPKQSELKAIIFALCFFHSIVCERRQFGAIGWNRPYPFAPGDLSASILIAANFLNDAPKVPWNDLQYLVGECMYGGHITDDWDRRLCAAYLTTYFCDQLLDGLTLYPKFEVPPATLSHKQFVEYVDENLINESPVCYGLHANSEINFMTAQANALFKAAGELAPRGGGGSGGMTLEERVKRILDDIMERLPDLFSLGELDERTQDERTPYTSVFLQECERMNNLLFEMKRSLVELDLGLKGDLGMSDAMEKVMYSLFDDKVPATWNKVAYPSMRGLTSWLSDALARQRQLEAWTADLSLPKVTWVAGLFNAQAFLTAVMQVTARRNELPLDRLTVLTDVTKKMTADEIEAPSRDGAYGSGFFMEGARWDTGTGQIEDSILKQLYCPMPVILIKAGMMDKGAGRDNFECPAYKTLTRNPVDGKPTGGYIFTAGLKTKQAAAKWILAGVSLFMYVES
jgi:dynein heavy chain